MCTPRHFQSAIEIDNVDEYPKPRGARSEMAEGACLPKSLCKQQCKVACKRMTGKKEKLSGL